MTIQQINLGSLDPLDVGFDLRTTRTPIHLPAIRKGQSLRVRLPREPGQVSGTIVEHFTIEAMADCLVDAGFVVQKKGEVTI